MNSDKEPQRRGIKTTTTVPLAVAAEVYYQLLNPLHCYVLLRVNMYSKFLVTFTEVQIQ